MKIKCVKKIYAIISRISRSIYNSFPHPPHQVAWGKLPHPSSKLPPLTLTPPFGQGKVAYPKGEGVKGRQLGGGVGNTPL